MSNTTEISKGGNVAYYINQEKGVVIAKVKCEIDEAYRIATTISHQVHSSDRHNSPLGIYTCACSDKYDLEPYYIGCAKCSSGDTFDLETGKQIALAKAQEKYHAALEKRLAAMSQHLCKISRKIELRALDEFERSQRCQNEYAHI